MEQQKVQAIKDRDDAIRDASGAREQSQRRELKIVTELSKLLPVATDTLAVLVFSPLTPFCARMVD
jgi:hypothetical protein